MPAGASFRRRRSGPGLHSPWRRNCPSHHRVCLAEKARLSCLASESALDQGLVPSPARPPTLHTCFVASPVSNETAGHRRPRAGLADPARPGRPRPARLRLAEAEAGGISDRESHQRRSPRVAARGLSLCARTRRRAPESGAGWRQAPSRADAFKRSSEHLEGPNCCTTFQPKRGQDFGEDDR